VQKEHPLVTSKNKGIINIEINSVPGGVFTAESVPRRSEKSTKKPLVWFDVLQPQVSQTLQRVEVELLCAITM